MVSYMPSNHRTQRFYIVLILVVVDDGLVLLSGATINIVQEAVLILVVVDDGLVHLFFCSVCMFKTCLNPCCSGRWSRTYKAWDTADNIEEVLILVVVDDGLVHINT